MQRLLWAHLYTTNNRNDLGKWNDHSAKQQIHLTNIRDWDRYPVESMDWTISLAPNL